MKLFKYYVFLLIPLVLFTSCRFSEKKKEEKSKFRIIGYVAGYRDFDFTKINATQLTHINFAFANVIDGKVQFDPSPIDGKVLSEKDLLALSKLKDTNPDLKILVSVGGWLWSGNFSDAALTVDSREIFAQSVADFVERYQLDGLDIDWEYPNQTGAGNIYREEDIENFTLLLKACREKLDLLAETNHKKEGYLLTIATGADSTYIRNTQLGEVQKYLDFINIMTYDFYNGLHHKTGHHSNLKPSPLDPDGNSLINSVQMHLDAGVPAAKLNTGIPFYGRKWEGVNPVENGLYQKAATTGEIIYYRIIKKEFFNNDKYTRYWDKDAEAPYLWNSTDSIFISYDDMESIRLKMEYIKNKGLGGAMFWEYTDNPGGELLKTIYEGLSGRYKRKEPRNKIQNPR